MSRPAYETVGHVASEIDVANFFCSRLGYVWKRCPKFYQCDYAIFAPGDSLYGLAEIKVRDAHYTEYMISLHKVVSMIQYAAVAECSPILIIHWRDTGAVGWCNLLHCTRRSGWGGRKDRGDAYDQEPALFIPAQEFAGLGVL